jgi:hypothetical protein
MIEGESFRVKNARFHFAAGVVLLGIAGVPVVAQSVISAKSGLVHYTQGRVLLAGRAVQTQLGQYPQMKEADTLQTARGRAEVLLNPGVFLRVGEDSLIRLSSGRLTESKVELVSGAAVLEAVQVSKTSTVTMAYGNSTISIRKQGLYRLEANPPALRVFDGKALVQYGDREMEIGKGKVLSLDGSWVTLKFDRKQLDALDRWSTRRATSLAVAKIRAAGSPRSRRAPWPLLACVGIPISECTTYVPGNGMLPSPNVTTTEVPEP